MYVIIIDTETTGLFPRGAASIPRGGDKRPPQTPSAPILNPSTQRGRQAQGGDKRPLRSASTPSAPILNPSTPRGFKVGSTPTLPYAVQISYAIIDTSSPFFPIVEDYDAIIRISESTPLPAESVAIHGITREIIRAKGVPIEHVLSILQRSLDTYDVQLVIGHNVAFDLRVLETERGRQAPPSTPPCKGATSAPFNPSAQIKSKPPSSSPDPTSTPGGDEHPLQPLRDDKYLKKSPDQVQAGGLRGLCPLHHLPSFCTARESVGVCNLRVESMYGGVYLKFGKLGYVFETLFKARDAARGVDMKVFEKYMHNSRVDVLMCARVFVWLCYSVDVFDAWYREMQNYADEDFINVDDSHLVRGGVEYPFEAPICGGGQSTPSTPEEGASSARSPCSPSPRRSDRLRLKRMLVQEQGSVLAY